MLDFFDRHFQLPVLPDEGRDGLCWSVRDRSGRCSCIDETTYGRGRHAWAFDAYLGYCAFGKRLFGFFTVYLIP